MRSFQTAPQVTLLFQETLITAYDQRGCVTQLLNAIDTIPDLNWLKHISAVQTLRHVWVQQFERVEERIHFRSDDNIPPPSKMICSPYDTEATYGRKLTAW